MWGAGEEAAIAMDLEGTKKFLYYLLCLQPNEREKRHLDVTFQTGKPVLLPHPRLPIPSHLLPHMNSHPTHGLAVLMPLSLWLSSPARACEAPSVQGDHET